MIDFILSTIESEEQRNELAALYAKYKSRLYAIAKSNLHNEIDAEDAVQQVFSEIADKPEIFFGVLPEKRAAYLSSMVKKLSINMFKSNNKIPKVPIDELNEDIEDCSIALENALFDKIDRDEVIQFVYKLSKMQRSVLILHCLHDLSVDETAQRLDISLSTVNKHLMLARKAIRVFIEERRNHE